MNPEEKLIRQLNHHLDQAEPVGVGEVEQFLQTTVVKRQRTQRYRRTVAVLGILLMGGGLLVVQQLKHRKTLASDNSPAMHAIENKTATPALRLIADQTLPQQQAKPKRRVASATKIHVSEHPELLYSDIADIHLSSYNEIAEMLAAPVNTSDYNNIDQPLNN
jgi:hypothetical protein